MKIAAYIIGGLACIILFIVCVSWMSTPTLPKPAPDGPLTSEAKEIVAARADSLEADRVLDAGYARPVPCGRIVSAAANPYNGKARYFYARDHAGSVECFDGDGYSRKEIGLKLRPIDGIILEEIRTNPDLYPGLKSSAAIVAPPSAQRPADPIDPESLPNLGDGPCCQSR